MTIDKKIYRFKEIGEPRQTLRVSIPEVRSFHFYFDTEVLNTKIYRERIQDVSFSTLIRNGNVEDLEDTINHGEKTGIFENPFILELLKKKD